jgi:hypothetical protein
MSADKMTVVPKVGYWLVEGLRDGFEFRLRRYEGYFGLSVRPGTFTEPFIVFLGSTAVEFRVPMSPRQETQSLVKIILDPATLPPLLNDPLMDAIVQTSR